MHYDSWQLHMNEWMNVCTGLLIWYSELLIHLISNKIKGALLLTHIMYTVYMYVYIDSNILWRSYIQSWKCGMCVRQSRLPREFTLSIYYALAFSHIVQSVIIRGGASETRINKIRTEINKILRVISHVKIYEFLCHF